MKNSNSDADGSHCAEKFSAPPQTLRGKFQARFRHFSQCTAAAVGTSWSFVIAVAIILAWAASYKFWPSFDTWQLVINTLTTVITFLMVFLIQNTQNRDARAMHLKLDELIHGVKGARNSLVDLESLSDEELDVLHTEFQTLRDRTNKHASQTGEMQTAANALNRLHKKFEEEKADRRREQP